MQIKPVPYINCAIIPPSQTRKRKNVMSNSIELPIEARSIFRILAINKIVERPEFVAQLGEQFEDFLRKIPFSGRIANVDNKYSDFLNYSTPHNGDMCDTDIDKMSEEQMCKSKECCIFVVTKT